MLTNSTYLLKSVRDIKGTVTPVQFEHYQDDHVAVVNKRQNCDCPGRCRIAYCCMCVSFPCVAGAIHDISYNMLAAMPCAQWAFVKVAVQRKKLGSKVLQRIACSFIPFPRTEV
jgi:hypothetical protein